LRPDPTAAPGAIDNTEQKPYGRSASKRLTVEATVGEFIGCRCVIKEQRYTTTDWNRLATRRDVLGDDAITVKRSLLGITGERPACDLKKVVLHRRL